MLAWAMKQQTKITTTTSAQCCKCCPTQCTSEDRGIQGTQVICLHGIFSLKEPEENKNMIGFISEYISFGKHRYMRIDRRLIHTEHLRILISNA